MGDELTDFLREGLEKFPEAYRAVTEFTETLSTRLGEALLRAQLDGFATSGRPVRGSGGNPREGCWVNAWLAGRVGDEPAKIEVGVWWAPESVAPVSPVLYLSVRTDSPERLRLLDGFVDSDRVNRRRLSKDVYLVVEPKRPLDPASVLRDIDLLLRSFATLLKKPTPTVTEDPV